MGGTRSCAATRVGLDQNISQPGLSDGPGKGNLPPDSLGLLTVRRP